MSKYDEMVKLHAEMDQIGLDALKEFLSVLKKEKLSLLDQVERDVELFKKTGQLVFNSNNDATSNSRSRSSKENIAECHSKSLRSSARPKRNVFTETSQVSNIQANVSVSKNSPEHINSIIPNMTIKLERLSIEFTKNHLDVQNAKIEDLKLKQEVKEMPPPLRPPIRQTRKKKGARNTSSSRNTDLQALNIKVERISEENKKQTEDVIVSSKPPSIVRDSDVQIHCEPIHTISLIDSEEKTEKPRTRGRSRTKKTQNKDQSSNSDQDNLNGTVHVTRTKTRNAAKNKEVESDVEAADNQKRLRSPSGADDSKTKKAGKSYPKRTRTENKQNEENNTSIYEDALSDSENAKNDAPSMEETDSTSKDSNKIQPVLNENIVAKYPALNETIVVEKPVTRQFISKVPDNQNDLKDLMMDVEDVVSPPKDKKSKLKQVFSPYASSPVRQRVQAFEKLRAEANCNIPPRMTRTKTKAKAKEQQENNPDNINEAVQSSFKNATRQGAIPKVKSSVTKKGSIPVLRTTPVSDNRATSEKCRQKGYHTNQSTDNTSMSGKPKSAMKSSQAEFRERELRRKQKEAEALYKKEALIQALAEERRRKREERQMKAQQTRDAIEKDKQKVLESAERIKEEKLKQALAEKEEKLLKQREEAARKRAIAQKKAAEEKQKELKRLEQERAKKIRDKDIIPPYLKYETPVLPTEDCYDSDDSNAGKSFSVPAWQKKEVLTRTLKYLRYLREQKSHLYCNGPKTVNLKEVFPSIEPHKLKRTSSAIWNRSGMSRLTLMVEEGEEGIAA